MTQPSAQFRKRFVDRMLEVGPSDPAQDRLGLSRAEADRRHVLDRLVVLLADQLPIDRLGEGQTQFFATTKRPYRLITGPAARSA